MSTESIITLIIGLFGGGTLGVLLSPWAKWKIEEKREKRNEQKNLIKELRSYLVDRDPKDKEFLNSSIYVRFRPYLSNEFVKELEDEQTTELHSGFRSYYTSKFLKELHLIEEQWGLNLPKKGRKNIKYDVPGQGWSVTVTKGNSIKNSNKDNT